MLLILVARQSALLSESHGSVEDLAMSGAGSSSTLKRERSMRF
jgi:hypothetical protein